MHSNGFRRVVLGRSYGFTSHSDRVVFKWRGEGERVGVPRL